jgi:hypothetical protein
MVTNTLTFKENAIAWFCSLLLDQTHADNMTGFDNDILIAYGMCPPVELMQYYQMDPATQPRHCMQGTATKVWGDDISKSCEVQLRIGTVMTVHRLGDFSPFFCFLLFILLRRNKLNIVSDDSPPYTVIPVRGWGQILKNWGIGEPE